MREMIFISHANPEDNEFTRWLALRLAAEGFPVWCDLTQLLGGEAFWTDIEDAIRFKTAKFLFVLSKSSNHKPGAVQEFGLAKGIQRDQKLKDFVLPLGIDDLKPLEYNIQLGQLNAIPFVGGWHMGLDQVISKLEKDGIARRPNFNRAAVASWWRERLGTESLLLKEPEALATNLYPIKPATLYFHRLALKLEDSPIEAPAIPYPAERLDRDLISFAPAEDLEPCLGTGMKIADTQSFRIGQSDTERPPWSFRVERTILTKLLNRAWQAMLEARGLPTHLFATGAPAFYFKLGTVEDDWVRFKESDGSGGSRQVVGTRGKEKVRYWHFSLGARPTTAPALGFVMRPHVLFSDDGQTIWESPERLARARQSQCKQWWNDRWRDLTIGSVHFLANGAGTLEIPVAKNTSLEMLTQPLEVACPVSYDEAALEVDDTAEDSVDVGDDEESEDGEEAE